MAKCGSMNEFSEGRVTWKDDKYVEPTCIFVFFCVSAGCNVGASESFLIVTSWWWSRAFCNNKMTNTWSPWAFIFRADISCIFLKKTTPFKWVNGWIYLDFIPPHKKIIILGGVEWRLALWTIKMSAWQSQIRPTEKMQALLFFIF